MSGPVVNSLIVTHSGRILDLLNGIMHDTEINDREDIKDTPKIKYDSKPVKWTNKLIKEIGKNLEDLTDMQRAILDAVKLFNRTEHHPRNFLCVLGESGRA